ncbi:MAG: hypothetical protein KC736_02985 [Candidatus Moranbacteria bacterium]|nr:hypothetical protein [Candidatus Moranbacteria bacterium]
MTKKRKYNIQKGFSIMELAIAAAVLTIVVTSVFTAFSSAITNSIDARNSVIAASLAQEAVEGVKNIRDTNIINQISRDATNKEPFVNIDDGCVKIDGDISIDTNCGNSFSNLNISSGFYTHANGESTIFRRKMEVSGSGDERIVTSEVRWGEDTSGNCTISNRCVKAQTKITSWLSGYTP